MVNLSRPSKSSTCQTSLFAWLWLAFWVSFSPYLPLPLLVFASFFIIHTHTHSHTPLFSRLHTITHIVKSPRDPTLYFIIILAIYLLLFFFVSNLSLALVTLFSSDSRTIFLNSRPTNCHSFIGESRILAHFYNHLE